MASIFHGMMDDHESSHVCVPRSARHVVCQRPTSPSAAHCPLSRMRTSPLMLSLSCCFSWHAIRGATTVPLSLSYCWAPGPVLCAHASPSAPPPLLAPATSILGTPLTGSFAAVTITECMVMLQMSTQTAAPKQLADRGQRCRPAAGHYARLWLAAPGQCSVSRCPLRSFVPEYQIATTTATVL